MLRAVCIAVALTLAAPVAPAWAGWLAAERLSVPAPVDADGVDVSVADDGTAIAVWERAAPTAGCCWTVQAAVLVPGLGWSAPRDLSTQGINARTPRVRVDAAGNALVVWTEDRVGGSVVRQRTRPAGGDFTPAEDLSIGGTAASPRAASNVELAMSPRGRAAVVWERSGPTGATIQAAVRENAGDHFPVPETISTAAGTDPEVTIDDTGNATAIWVGSLIAAATRPAGGSWSSPTNLSTEKGSTPIVTVAPSGTVAALWFTSEPPRRVLRAFRTRSGWGAETLMARSYAPRFDATYDQDGTLVLVSGVPSDDDGGALVFSTLSPAGVSTVTPITPFAYATGERSFVSRFRGGTMVLWEHALGWSTRMRPTAGQLETAELATPTDPMLSGEIRAAGDDQGNATAVWQQRDADGYAVWSAAYDGVPPVLSAISVPEAISLTATATMRAQAADRVSGTSISWDFGDGTTAAGPAVEHTYSEPGTRTVTVTARDGAGHETRATRSIVIVAPPPPPPLVPVDADGDGYSPPTDCDDASPAIRPGVPERPGNAVDENCDGRKDPFTTVTATVQLTSQFLGNRSTLLLRLVVRDLAAGDVVQLSCSGRGCRKSMQRTVSVRKAAKSLSLTRFVRGIRLRPRTTLSVRISHSQQIARQFRYTMRSQGSGTPRLTVQCKDPGATQRRRC